jgi:hypothetical protein
MLGIGMMLLSQIVIPTKIIREVVLFYRAGRDKTSIRGVWWIFAY